MAIVRAYGQQQPRLGDGVFAAESAAIIGDVVIGPESSIWYGTVVRGDVFPIRIGAQCSIQDNSVVHVTGGKHGTVVGDRVTVGHRAILHGCTIGDECLIGMGAIVMDGVQVGSHCIVGAGSLVSPGTVIPEGHLALGSPARVVRPLRSGEFEHIRLSAAHYVDLAASYIASEGATSLL